MCRIRSDQLLPAKRNRCLINDTKSPAHIFAPVAVPWCAVRRSVTLNFKVASNFRLFAVSFRKKSHSPFDPLLVLGDVLGVEQFGGGRVLAEAVLGHGARVHEGLRCHGQTRVYDVRLVHVKHEVRILHHVDPEPQRQTAKTSRMKHAKLTAKFKAKISITSTATPKSTQGRLHLSVSIIGQVDEGGVCCLLARPGLYHEVINQHPKEASLANNCQK